MILFDIINKNSNRLLFFINLNFIILLLNFNLIFIMYYNDYFLKMKKRNLFYILKLKLDIICSINYII